MRLSLALSQSANAKIELSNHLVRFQIRNDLTKEICVVVGVQIFSWMLLDSDCNLNQLATARLKCCFRGDENISVYTQPNSFKNTTFVIHTGMFLQSSKMYHSASQLQILHVIDNKHQALS